MLPHSQGQARKAKELTSDRYEKILNVRVKRAYGFKRGSEIFVSPFFLEAKKSKFMNCCDKIILRVSCAVCKVEVKKEVRNIGDFDYSRNYIRNHVLTDFLDKLLNNICENLDHAHDVVKFYTPSTEDGNDINIIDNDNNIIDNYNNIINDDNNIIVAGAKIIKTKDENGKSFHVEGGNKIVKLNHYNPLSGWCPIKSIISCKFCKEIISVFNEKYFNDRKFDAKMTERIISRKINTHLHFCKRFRNIRFNLITANNTCREDIVKYINSSKYDEKDKIGESEQFSAPNARRVLQSIIDIKPCECGMSWQVNCQICGAKTNYLHINDAWTYDRVVGKHFGINAPTGTYKDFLTQGERKLEEYEAVIHPEWWGNDPPEIHKKNKYKCVAFLCAICGKEYSRSVCLPGSDPEDIVNCPPEEVVLAHFEACAKAHKTYFRENGYCCS